MVLTGEIFSGGVQKRPPELFQVYGNSARPLLTAQLRMPLTQHSPLLLFAAAVAKHPDSPPPAETLARPYADFGFDVLRDLSAEHPSENIFLSPYSIAVSLAMLANGANGTTRQAILKTIHSEGQSPAALNAANRALIEQINKTTTVQLATANGLFVDNSSEVNPGFTQTLHSAYGAEAENVDFRSPATAQKINAWVAQHTNDRIQKILDQISPLTVIILADAMAFKGKWSIPFEAKLTEPHNFKGSRGVRKVPMMSHSARYSYTNQNSLETIRLLYANGAFAMYLVLPKDEAAMRSFLERLTAERFSTYISSLESRSGTIDLPRFSITYREMLNKTLAKLGMGVAFENSADFSGIPQRPAQLRISEIRHASFLKVDEEGTEAAAATTTGIATISVRPVTQPFHMVVDHPFFVAIRDERSGQILFMGVIEQPEG
jgi:serpin B